MVGAAKGLASGDWRHHILTPADLFYGRGQKIRDERQAIKLNTLAMRRKMHYDNRDNLNRMS